MSAAHRWRTTPRGASSALWIALAFGAASCGFDGPTAPTFGYVKVSVNTSGGDLDIDGYSVQLDASESRHVASTGAESFYTTSGEHTVSIRSIAANCSVTSPVSVSVSVTERQVAPVAFDVVCLATGIAVTSRTTGPDSPNDLRFVLDESPATLVAANGAQTFGRLAPGDHHISIIAPANCTVAGGTSISVPVVLSKVTSVALDVSCTLIIRLPKIAYAAEQFVNGASVRMIELVNVDGTGAQSLQAGDAPAWSPDGKRLVFSDAACPRGGFYYYYDYCTGGLIVADPENWNATVLDGGRSGAHPSWSPTGRGIVFDNLESAPNRVLSVLATSSNKAVALPVGAVTAASQPAWSPDGAQIAFVCTWTTSTDLCVANADGSNVVRLDEDVRLDQEPAWHPDGKSIAFARYPFGRTDDGSAEVAVMDLATRQIRVLGAGADPAWSPDGSRLVFAGLDGLFVMNADGSGRTRLTTGLHHAPAWRP
jgi:TolB protein